MRETVAMRVAVAAIVGLAVALALGATAGWEYALAGWVAAAAVYVGATWLIVFGMDANETASHATGEDPTRAVASVIVVTASIASLGGVAYVLIAGSTTGSQSIATAVLGVVSVVASWCAVHTLFTAHYARLYYIDEYGGIDFNQEELPCYVDFGYLAFTVGMTYQVSDTDIQTSAIRRAVLQQALVSFVFGAVILAVTVNLIAGLGTGH